jgi:signal transduction histidine kinase
VGTVGALIAQARRIDLVWADRAAAGVFAVGAIVDAGSQPHQSLGAVALASLVVLMGSIAWRRVDPVAATVAAVSALIVFTVSSRYHGDGSFEVAAIALNFYTVGRRSLTGLSVVASATLLAYWLAGAAVVTYVPPGGSAGSFLGGWAFAGVLPFGVGWVLERRRALVDELSAQAAELRGEQELRARRAAMEERNRMARELHDVIAHCMSVMVVQTVAARRIASTDIAAARGGLRAVERSGREALVELRRLVGALRREGEDLTDSVAPGLEQLEALLHRARAAGLPVEVRIEGRSGTLSPEVDLVAYRVVQEALTNAIKHAGPATASVTIVVGADALDVRVSDTGRGPGGGLAGERTSPNGTGHGLVGMAERVELYGGTLRTGLRAGGGFEVSAQIPLAQTVPASQRTAEAGAELPTSREAVGLRLPWLDRVIALVSVVVLVAGVLAASHRRGPVALDLSVAAVIGLAAAWRRRSPLAFVIVVGVLGSVTNTYLVALESSPVIGAYLILVPSYTAGAWVRGRQGAFALAFLLGGAAVSELVSQRGRAGDFAGGAFTVTAAWAAGRAVRSYRDLIRELRRTSARLAVEREDRARLAIAAERSRIARELHAAVAGSVASMVVQAEAALRQLERDPAGAERAMDAAEHTGRRALADMRRILGVLRHGEDRGERYPQPGVDQIYALIERARQDGQQVALTVEGDPGTLSPGVELALYRILESALYDVERRDPAPIAVRLRFGSGDLDLQLTAGRDGPSGWPTTAMRERLQLSGGQLEPPPTVSHGWAFTARLPCAPQEQLV